jgi:hypothetical protein
MHLNPADISHYFQRKPNEHQQGETPCLVAPELARVDDEEKDEEGAEEGVAAEVGDVADVGLGEGTGSDCAFMDVVDDCHCGFELIDRIGEERSRVPA